MPDLNNENEVWVAFDLDDCLANMRDPLRASMERHTGKTLQCSDWDTYDFFKEYMDLEAFLALIVKDGVAGQCLPEPGSVQTLCELGNFGIKTAIVTARAYLPDAQSATLQWLDVHGLGVDKLVIVAPGQNKADALLALPNLLGYVDDHAKHLDDVAAAFAVHGRSVHLSLMDRPWNQHTDLHHRVGHLADFKKEILELHKLAVNGNFSQNRNQRTLRS